VKRNADLGPRREYVALIGSFILILLEGLIRAITLLLRECSLHVQAMVANYYSATYHPLLLQQLQTSIQWPLFQDKPPGAVQEAIASSFHGPS
jgi:hypothetical protein